MPLSLRPLAPRPRPSGASPWIRAVYAEGALGGLYGALTGGTVLTGLLIWSGASLFEIGLLSAVTTGGGLLVLLTGRLQRRWPSHKRLTQLAWTAAWAVWLPIGLILAILAATGQTGGRLIGPLVLGAVFIAAGLSGIGNVFWSYWVARIVPRDGRGAFLAGRARWLNLAGLLVLPIVGILLDASKAAQRDIVGFAALLCASVVCALARHSLLGRIPETREFETDEPTSAPTRRGATLSAERYTVYTVLWQIGVYLGAPFFQVYLLQRLGLSFAVLMYLQVLSQIVPILTLGWWGRVVDRIGARRPLLICTIGKVLVPLSYLAATPEFWWPVVIGYLISILDAGLTVANSTTLAQLAEGQGGSARVARVSLLTSLVAGVTPIIAGLIVAGLQAGGQDALAVAFTLSAIGRLVAGVSLVSPSARHWPAALRSRT